MMRMASSLAAATLLVAATAARAGEAGEGMSATERRLEEVLAELEAQRAQIADLKALMAPQDSGSVGEAVKKYLESDEGRKALGRDKGALNAMWKDGLAFESADKDFSLKVNGRIMFDMVFPDVDDKLEAFTIPATGAAVGDIDPLAGFRRLRVEFSGTIYKDFYYANVIDFSATPHQLKDNYIGYKGLPGGTSVQVGYFKEPVGLDELTSSKYITFTERSLATNAFAPAHNLGIMLLGGLMEDRVNWAIGDFTDHGASGVGAAQWQHNFTARLCGTPLLDKDRKTLLHLGLSMQDRSPESENDRFRVRPGTPFTPRTQDTGTFSVDSETIFGFEGALVTGPFSFQGEMYKASIEDHPDAPGPSPQFGGWYGMVSWFVTGESRPYKGGSFGRVKPKSNFDGKNGTGAIELALRVEALDLDDDGLDGGVGRASTLGVNWYMNPNTRLMLNYVMYSLSHDRGDVNSVVLRFQIDF
jgi:phosphate-selective porin OprO/OprP